MRYLAFLLLFCTSALGQSIGGGGAAGGSGAEVTYHRNLTCEVDLTFGNDAAASCGGRPFKTLQAAVAAVQPGGLVLAWPGTYNLTAPLVVPANTVLRCISVGSCTLARFGVTTNADLIELNSASIVDNWTLFLTSSMHVNLRAVIFNDPSPATRDGNLRNSLIIVDNSTAGDGGSSDVYGVYHRSPQTPARGLPASRSNTLILTSAGQGKKRGVVKDTAGSFHLRDMNIVLVKVGAGTGTYYGVETNHASALISADSGNIDGGASGQDISQSLGTILVGATVITNFTANGLGFSNAIATAVYVFCDPASIGQGTKFMYLGCNASSTTNEVKLRMPRQGLAKSVFVKAATAPGVGNTTTWTVRKNGVDTGLIVSLTGTNTAATFDAVSVHYNAADELSLKVVAGVGDATANVIVGVEVY